jgi:hypothetical protein
MAGPARVDAARERVVAEHREPLTATLAAADAVATDPDALADGGTLRRGLRERLADRGLLARYPAVLRTAVAAAGRELAADPVPAPPYVVVASTGPVLRGSTDAGRIVVALRAFAVRDRNNIDSDTGSRYKTTTGELDEKLEVVYLGRNRAE